MPTDAQQKAAILLQMFGDDVAEQVLSSLPADAAREIRDVLRQLPDQPATRRRKEQAVVEFERFYRFARKVGDRRLRIAAGTSMDDEDESAGRRGWQPFEPGDDPLEDLKKLAPQQLAGCLSHEHPRTAAVVLRQLPGECSADVLELMPDELRRQVFVQLSREAPIEPGLVERIASAVVRKSVTLDPEPAPEPDPIQMAADVLRSVNRPQRRPLLEALETSNQESATQLLERLYVFDDLLELDSRNLQRLLGEIDSQTLATALCGAAPELTEKVMSNLAKRARAALQEEMDFQQNTSPAIIEQARKAVAGILAQLDQDEV